MSILKFEPNEPREVVLKYPSPRIVEGTYGDQAMYSLLGGDLMYVPLIVQKKLESIDAKPGQKLLIEKSKTNGKVTWNVTRPAKPQLVAKLLDGPALEEYPDEAPRKPPTTQLANALKTALAAAKEAEAYSQEIGHPVQFDKDDVRLMAQTLVINASKERAA